VGLNFHKVATVVTMKRDQLGLGFQGHRVGDKAAKGAQGTIGGIKRVTRQATADEHSIRCIKTFEGLGDGSVDEFEFWGTKREGILRSHSAAVGAGFNADSFAVTGCAEPLHRDGSTTGAHIPQQTTAHWDELGQRCGANLAFGHSAV
jgi:hypothetical protein